MTSFSVHNTPQFFCIFPVDDLAVCGNMLERERERERETNRQSLTRVYNKNQLVKQRCSTNIFSYSTHILSQSGTVETAFDWDFFVSLCAEKGRKGYFYLSGTPESIAKAFFAFSGTPESIAKAFLPFSGTPESIVKAFLPFSGTPESIAKAILPFSGTPESIAKGFLPLAGTSDTFPTPVKQHDEYNIRNEIKI